MKTWTYFLESKSVALENFKKIRSLVENYYTRKAIKSIQTNTGKEHLRDLFLILVFFFSIFCTNDFLHLCSNNACNTKGSEHD
jgi:hypothetical protein